MRIVNLRVVVRFGGCDRGHLDGFSMRSGNPLLIDTEALPIDRRRFLVG